MPSSSRTEFVQQVVVGLADLVVSADPNVVLATASLGSGIGVSIYDPVVHAGGLWHAVLPDSRLDPAEAAAQPALFVDTGLPALLRAVHGVGAEDRRVQICLAGGAQFLAPDPVLNLGQRNVAAMRRLLSQLGLVVCAEQLGGQASRALFLDLATGRVQIKSSGCPQKVSVWKN